MPDPEAGSPEAACGSPLSRGHAGCARLCPPEAPAGGGLVVPVEFLPRVLFLVPTQCFYLAVTATRSELHARTW